MPGPCAPFSVTQKILFRHCDPAGIVFYPRYFEMVNDAIEALFSDQIGWPFEHMHQTHAGPTVALEATFSAVSRHGDVLDMCVSVERLGKSSLKLRTEGWCDNQLRFTVVNTMVCIDANTKSTPWPKSVRKKLEQLMGPQE